MNKDLTKINVTYGIIQYSNDKLEYACRLQGVITERDKDFMSIVKTDKDRSDDIEVDILLSYKNKIKITQIAS